MKLHLKLHKLCNQKGWDQSQLLRQSGEPVSPSTMSSYWSGKSRPSLDAAMAFARALSVPLEYLADDSLDEPPAGPGLSEQEVIILTLAREMGPQVAMRRLAALPDIRPLSVEQADQLRKELGR